MGIYDGRLPDGYRERVGAKKYPNRDSRLLYADDAENQAYSAFEVDFLPRNNLSLQRTNRIVAIEEEKKDSLPQV